MQTLNNDDLSEDIKATYNWLTTQENVDQQKIAAIGFCLGGRVAFLANSILPLCSAVSYYGGAIQHYQDYVNSLSGPILFFWGGLDQHIKPELINALTGAVAAAGKQYVNTVISYADHGFNCDERAAYNADAAKEAWAMTTAFLENKFESAGK